MKPKLGRTGIGGMRGKAKRMSKKILLASLVVIAAAAFVSPFYAKATEEDIPLHLIPGKAPFVAHVTGPEGVLSTTSGNQVFCGPEGLSGSATFESGTAGVLQLTFKGSGETEKLPFNLLTLPSEKPGILITPSANGNFLPCGIFFLKAVGNGLIGTITSPSCGQKSTDLTIAFRALASGVQEHKKVAGTATEYHLNVGSSAAALAQTMTFKFEEEHELVCT